MERTVLYRDDEVFLVAIGDPAGRPCCVTFSTLMGDKDFLGENTVGFGEKRLREFGIPTLHVLSTRNHWWQVAHSDLWVEVARSWISKSTYATGYSASMGAHGVLSFGGRLGLQQIVAFCPQFSADPAVVPWEPRWMEYRSEIDFHMPFGGPAEGSDVHVIYDDRFTADRRHVEMIVSACPQARFYLHSLDKADHWTVMAMHKKGLLAPLVASMAKGKIDTTPLKAHPDYRMVMPEERLGYTKSVADRQRELARVIEQIDNAENVDQLKGALRMIVANIAASLR